MDDDNTLSLARAPVRPREFTGTERYRLRGPLGKGGMGEVFEVDDLELGTTCALKCLCNPDAAFVLRFKDEFRALRDIVHPNLVRLGELHESQGQFFFTMELLHGTDLLRYVRPEALALSGASSATPSGVSKETAATPLPRPGARTRDGRLKSGEQVLGEHALVGGFDEARLRSAFAQLAVGLSALHRAGKIHRDLKPSNVMVEPDGRVVILDFGVVAELAQQGEAGERMIVGTVQFMAPEQARGEPPAPPADWYAVGVALYQALTGRLPHPARSYALMLARKTRREPIPMALGEHESVRDLVNLTMSLLTLDPNARASEREVFEVLGLGESSAGLGAGALVDAGALELLGREHELETLSLAFAQAHASQALTVIIEGPSGMGKSALLRKFSQVLSHDDPPALVLYARCHERESLRFKAFDGVVDGMARHLSARSRRGQRFEAKKDDLAALCRLFPVLRSVPGFARAETNDSDSARDPVELRGRAFDTLRALFTQVCEHRPVLVGIDDLHWADADSLALLEAILRPPHAPRLLLVATKRPGVDPLGQRKIGEVRTLTLRGLAPDAARDLLTRELVQAGVATLPDLDELLSEAAGHPMFLEELVRMSRGSLEHEKAGLRLDDALRTRAARLSEHAQRLLESIAVAGAPTQHRVMIEVAGLTGGHYARAVEALRTERLIRVSGLRRVDAIEPYHDRVREALYVTLSGARAEALHDALAASLIMHEGSQATIASHLELGSEPARAAAYFLRAADEARAALAFERAARLRQRALACGNPTGQARIELLVNIADDLSLAGFAKEAGDTLLELGRAHGHSAHARVDFVRRAAELYLSSGHLDLGHAAAGEALSAVGRSLPRSRAHAIFSFLWSDVRVGLARFRVPQGRELSLQGREQLEADVLWSLGVGLALVDSVEAAVLANEALLHALAHGGPEHAARCLCAAAALASTVGRFGRAARMRAAFDAALDVRADPTIRLYRQIADLAHLFLCENDWQGTVNTAAEARATWTLLGQKRGWEKAQLAQLECWALHQLGDISALRTRVHENLREARETGNRFIEVNFRTFFIDMALADDTPDAALADVQDAIGLWKPLSSEFNNQDYLVIGSRTRIALYAGRDDVTLDREWQRFDGSLLTRVLLLSQDALMLRTGLHQLRARRARERGAESDAKAELSRAQRLHAKLARHPLPLARMEAQALKAGIEDLTGHTDQAVLELRACLPRFRARHMHLWSACIAHELGRRIGGEEGRALLAEATSGFAMHGIKNPELTLRGMLPGLSEAG
jgi:serine/threonine protein kinase